MIRFRMAKSAVLKPFWKVATLPDGRKSIAPGPSLLSGTQLTIALGVSTVIVSLVGPVTTRVTVPLAVVGLP